MKELAFDVLLGNRALKSLKFQMKSPTGENLFDQIQVPIKMTVDKSMSNHTHKNQNHTPLSEGISKNSLKLTDICSANFFLNSNNIPFSLTIPFV